eukprot:jgi/Chlat1/6627/Chrsp482S06105
MAETALVVLSPAAGTSWVVGQALSVTGDACHPDMDRRSWDITILAPVPTSTPATPTTSGDSCYQQDMSCVISFTLVPPKHKLLCGTAAGGADGDNGGRVHCEHDMHATAALNTMVRHARWLSCVSGGALRYRKDTVTPTDILANRVFVLQLPVCDEREGQGVVRCNLWNAKGKIYNGVGVHVCRQCRGEKVVVCPICGGKCFCETPMQRRRLHDDIHHAMDTMNW